MWAAFVLSFFFTGLPAFFAFAWFALSEQYRINRILAFLDPFKNPLGEGYQLVQSLYAFGLGGFTGVGLGASTQKLLYSEAHNDFIMAILGEEMGFIGVSFVMLLQTFLFYRAFRIVLKQEDLRDRLSAFGVTLILLLSTGLNLAMALSALPLRVLPCRF